MKVRFEEDIVYYS